MGLGKRESGLATLIDPGADRPLLEIPTVMCVHCGGAFPRPDLGPGAGARQSRIGRGFCQNCNGYVCGRACAECVPVEVYLSNIEAGASGDHKPICVPTRIYTGD